MPDRPKCIDDAPPPPADDDGDHLFRHTFLWRLTDPEDREALLHLAEGFQNLMNEAGCWSGEPMLPGMAGALADDVEALAAYALGIARTGEHSKLEPGDAGVVHFAAQWAERLAIIATEIRIVVAAARGAA